MNPLEQICLEQNISFMELMKKLKRDGNTVLSPEYWKDPGEQKSTQQKPAEPVPYRLVVPYQSAVTPDPALVPKAVTVVEPRAFPESQALPVTSAVPPTPVAPKSSVELPATVLKNVPITAPITPASPGQYANTTVSNDIVSNDVVSNYTVPPDNTDDEISDEVDPLIPQAPQARYRLLAQLAAIGELGARRIQEHNPQILANGAFIPYYRRARHVNDLLHELYGSKIPRKETAKDNGDYWKLANLEKLESRLTGERNDKAEYLLAWRILPEDSGRVDHDQLSSFVTIGEIEDRIDTLDEILISMETKDCSFLLQENPQIMNWTFKFKEYTSQLAGLVQKIVTTGMSAEYTKDLRLADPAVFVDIQRELDIYAKLANIQGEDRRYLIPENRAILDQKFKLEQYLKNLDELQHKINSSDCAKKYQNDLRFAYPERLTEIRQELDRIQSEDVTGNTGVVGRVAVEKVAARGVPAPRTSLQTKLEEKMEQTRREYVAVRGPIEQKSYDFCMTHAILTSMCRPGGGQTALGSHRILESSLYSHGVENWYLNIGRVGGQNIKRLFDRTMRMLIRDRVVLPKYASSLKTYSVNSDLAQVPAAFHPYLKREIHT